MLLRHLLLLSLVAMACSAATPLTLVELTVDAVHGSDTEGTGQPDAPFQTIQHAVSVAISTTSLADAVSSGAGTGAGGVSVGVVVTVNPGSYSGLPVALACQAPSAIGSLEIAGSGDATVLNLAFAVTSCNLTIRNTLVTLPSVWNVVYGSATIQNVRVESTAFACAVREASLQVDSCFFHNVSGISLPNAPAVAPVVSAIASENTAAVLQFSNVTFSDSSSAIPSASLPRLVWSSGMQDVLVNASTFRRLEASASALLHFDSISGSLSVTNCVFSDVQASPSPAVPDTSIVRISSSNQVAFSTTQFTRCSTTNLAAIELSNQFNATITSCQFADNLVATSNLNSGTIISAVDAASSASLTVRSSTVTCNALLQPDTSRRFYAPVGGLSNGQLHSANVIIDRSCPSSSANSAPCPAGFSVTHSLQCMPCAAGSIPSADQLSCTSCPAGTFAGSDGSTVCEPCPVDTYAGGPGQSMCYTCSNTLLTSSEGASLCTTPTTLCIALISIASVLIATSAVGLTHARLTANRTALQSRIQRAKLSPAQRRKQGRPNYGAMSIDEWQRQ
ncbi:hypothetical protein CAOG_01601 [Capsaspora owczarzaki ATCC 30864]|uniref:Tyrosine-protein kinase ephrin type A/B receptor-like domain-containing protein n=1 Tax=Capsaspora owczarzaki (strain ATCC 30864) TaxID=595528 RepID=A0A0D2U529_CAPO3|nr:hypothetical protein CAOG_01601 [Capsaspora owczarzaki ATCC 30864]KJE90266.1 hypothetical protein CAOG_001601 [Capsaspora owczarzaki ATCC 30864]|eukprot:XP_004364469.1 hypothetical protein CAOG_01601 [Capsaspora owczarzaki ATCC 30864]